MACFAKVERRRSPEMRRSLSRDGLLDQDLRALNLGDSVLWPLTREASEDDAERLGFEIAPLPKGKRAMYRSPLAEVKARLAFPSELDALLPRKWELIGDVLVLRLPAKLEEEAGRIASCYADVLGARTVCQETGPIEGVHRTPSMKVLHGSGTETVHRENGILYKLDVARVMFSSGNKAEKARMSGLDCRGETIVDMFAGIGYFTLPLAKHAKARKVVACEINPDAHRYLDENVRLNGLEKTVEAFLGDNRSLPGEGFADRVVMGYLGTTADFLPKAFGLVRDGGIVHFHDICPVELFPTRPLAQIEASAKGRKVKVLRAAEVKSYAPLVSHCVIDFRVG